MGLSDCDCGGTIALGPRASNACNLCGQGVFTQDMEDEAFRQLRKRLDMGPLTSYGKRAATAVKEIDRLRFLLSKAGGLFRYFDDGCTCVVLCKDGPCPRCQVRAIIPEIKAATS